MNLAKLITPATLLAALMLAAAPADAQHGDRRQSSGRAGDVRVVGAEHRFPDRSDHLVRRGWDRRLHGGRLTVRPCDEPFPYGPRRPNGACISLYPDISVSRGGMTGGLRLQIEPASAAVYVDDVYAGIVEAFNGDSQRLVLTPGRHRIDVRAPDHQPLQFEISIQPGRTTTHHGTLSPASSTPLE